MALVLSMAAVFAAAGTGRAQTVKSITVSGDSSYTDHISLSEDARDMDVMVKFIFDEQNNRLMVVALSYRSLFVFREPSRYRNVIRCSRLLPERLPYVAQADEGSVFKLSRPLRKSIPRPRREYVFNRWIEYEGLQPVPTEYNMVNDYIEQSFDILPGRDNVTVTLRDLFLLERSDKNPGEYSLLRGSDLNMKYRIQIQRNPCLGLEKELETAVQLCGEAKAAYESLCKTYPGGEVASEDALQTFEQTRTLLLTQFPARQNLTACPAIREAFREYNQYVDSIAAFTCKVRAEEKPVWDSSKGLDVKYIYTQARQLDKSVARYLVSKDELERQDLIAQCKDIVEDVNSVIKRNPARTAEERKAVSVYRQAEKYYRKTCKQ